MNVYVVLSRSRTVLSRTIRLATRDEYTHASLSLDPGLDLMFSFGRRRASNPFVGCFKRERLDEGMYRDMPVLPGAVLAIPVSPAQHEAISTRVAEFVLDGHTYTYNAPGLVTGLFGRGSEDDTRFFCSEFVYHVLRDAGVCDLGVPRWKVRPQTLLSVPGRVVFRGNLKRYAAAQPSDPAAATLMFARSYGLLPAVREADRMPARAADRVPA
ncbi:hypothetical protein LEP48_11935 [Isoptericola sp. NEAU-Y5]|uniref:Uncharacterized protein n=1 Tax=Isoptericola luteus TaxID=2879484 RepID=A0ABS7ZHS5_9MICO|nr:hypothetical protein [Isoptericola sp. NEAU-Y5]MCA5894052.1 hypothetical protein [Isoptericola sp. NEAU-Y5]